MVDENDELVVNEWLHGCLMALITYSLLIDVYVNKFTYSLLIDVIDESCFND